MVVPEPRGGVSEGKIRLRQPLTGQGARAHGRREEEDTGEMTIMNINSRRREQNLTNDADRSCESHHHSLSRTRRVKRFPHSTSPLES